MRKDGFSMDSQPNHAGLTTGQFVVKRCLDLFLAIIGLMLTWWLIAIAWVLATIDTRTNGFFTQLRVGRNGELFKVIKIRTMRIDPEVSTTVTTSSDRRITPLGKFWRRSKIDELPQLLNILFGHMSFVGPRPDVPGFADRLEGADRVVLSVRPGITGPATIKYRNEEELLAAVDDSEVYNRDVIFPDKVRINREYIEHWSIIKDMKYILQTAFGN
jgi:lipopolysaccharide/colanic/teichoic acid biosynthesis glycosyltransferase